MKMIDFNAKKGFLCDMDGVIYHGSHILPGAAEFIHWLQDTHKEYLFLTNNSGMTPRELHQKLWRMGLDVPEEHFYTSALATAAFLADQAPGCSVYALGEAGLLNALYDRGITMNDATGEGGDELVEIMAGTFIICGFNPDSGEDTSLTPQQAEYWMRRFHEPETFVQTMDGSIHAIPIR